MIRLSTVVWLALVAVIGFAMFKVKYEVMSLEDQLARLNRSIAADQDALHVLKAEWSYLSQPSRLNDLNQRFLGLAPMATSQLAQMDRLAQIPFRNVEEPAVAGAAAPAPSPAAAGAKAKERIARPHATPAAIRVANAGPRSVSSSRSVR